MTKNDWKKTFDTILNKLEELNIQGLEICDHICYRVETIERYDEMKNFFEQDGVIAAETMVSGRMISIIQLNNPLKYRGFEIQCIELPAPKEGRHFNEGWEHAEFVVKDLDKFISDHNGLDFNKKSMNRDINPELGLPLGEGLQVKFHPLHILDVIAKEKELGIEEVN
jgi:predicted metalloenzyme YecM